MTGPDVLEAQVLVSSEVPPNKDDELIAAFASLGVAASSRVVPPRRSIGEIQWMILISLPVQAFLTALVSKLAEDAYKRLKSLVGRALGQPSATHERPKVLILQDPTTRLQIILEDNLPTGAYQRLLALDLATVHGVPLYYDRRHDRWRSQLDEADADSPGRSLRPELDP
jgi:hypothetical protein